MSDIQAKKKRKKKPGRPPRSGAYSLMVQAGELPKRRTYLRAYLQAARDGLIEDLGPREADLTTAQRVLVDRAVSKLSVVRCVEEYVKEEGVFKGRELSPVLAKSYITYCESIRRDLEALGISKRAGERILSPLEMAAVIDAEKAEKSAADGQAPADIAPHRATSNDVSGQDGGAVHDKGQGGGDTGKDSSEIAAPVQSLSEIEGEIEADERERA